MPDASVRSVAQNAANAANFQAERDTAKTGDILLAFHSADVGGASTMSIDGTWQPLAELTGGGLAGTRVWGRTIQAGEPTLYEVTQQSGADGTVILLVVRNASLADIVVETLSGLITPSALPSTASGLEIRYAAGSAANQATSWTPLAGYQGLDVQSRTFTTATLACRPYSSNAEQPPVVLTPAPSLPGGHAVTILIKSAATSGGGTPPTPVPFPPFTPAKGVTRTSYIGLDLLTGDFRGDLPTLKDVSLDGRFNEAGSFSARIPLPGRLEAAKAAEVFPPDEYDLTAGVGRTILHTWRSGVLWGPHWIHTCVETRNERTGTVELAIQGVTLTGYLGHVALLEAIELDHGDQLDNARNLIQIALDDPGSNIGITLGEGVSPSDRVLKGDVDAYIGQLLQTYARVEGGFEYADGARLVDGSVLRTLEFGAPKIDKPDVVHEFVESPTGGDIVTWTRTRSALSGHTRLAVIGGTPQQTDVTTTATPLRSALLEATDHLAAGYPIVDKRLRHESTVQGTIDDYAAYWASRTPGAPPVFQCTVLLGAGSTFGPNSLGEYARITLNNPRYPIRSDGSPTFDRTMRIIGWQLQPRSRGRGKDRLQLVLEGATLT